ncbi:MAG: trimethylamine methyltransferase family protein [bacterium]
MFDIFTENELDLLKTKVRRVLKDIGYKVENEELSLLLKKKGLKLSSNGRFTFDDKIIDEFVSFQKKSQEKRKTIPKAERRRIYKTGFGNLASKYYDYSTKRPLTAKKQHFEKLIKFAHQEDKIGGVSMPLSLTDIPLETAPIESFLMMVRLTNKYGYGIEPYSVRLIKYLVELSKVFLGEGCEDRFFDHCNCINPILRLENRTAAVMLERAKYNITSLMTSMPTAGGNAPVTLDGVVIQGTAEIVGGLIISYLINPEAVLLGYISSSVMDFKTAVTSQSTPESVLIDCGVVQLMDYDFGGKTSVGGTTYVAAREPGFKAVFEKMFKVIAYQKFLGRLSYGGAGILDNGSLISPEQLVIDIEIGESFSYLSRKEMDDNNIEDVIAEVAKEGKGDFLSTEHTLKNFRNAFWEPFLFLRGSGTSEKEVLDRAHGIFNNKVKEYSGYDYDKDKIKAGEEILKRAKRELLV